MLKQTMYLLQPGNDTMISVSFFRLFRVMRLVKLLSKETSSNQYITSSIQFKPVYNQFNPIQTSS